MNCVVADNLLALHSLSASSRRSRGKCWRRYNTDWNPRSSLVFATMRYNL